MLQLLVVHFRQLTNDVNAFDSDGDYLHTLDHLWVEIVAQKYLVYKSISLRQADQMIQKSSNNKSL
jgi:hypothetical protein